VRKTTVILALLLLAGITSAQTMMPISPYSSTYSSTYTRGFHFQAPVDFAIVGLRVPDESNNGKHNVCVYKMPGQPANYPQDTKGFLQFLSFGTSSSLMIPCGISFAKGEWVGILGACGDASRMHNSYGTGAYKSSVLGTATSISRFGMQANMVANKGNYNVWGVPAGSSGSIGRVEVYVAKTSLIGAGTGAPGSNVDFTLTLPADAGLPYQMASSFGFGPIPIDKRVLGLSLDALVILSVSGALPTTFLNYAGVLDKGGMAKATIRIPTLPALKGIGVFTAFVTLKGSAPSGLASISPTYGFLIM
jgi:hypothetical protein